MFLLPSFLANIWLHVGWVPRDRIYCMIIGSTRVTESGARLDWDFRLGMFYMARDKQRSIPIEAQLDPNFQLLADDVPRLGINGDAFQLGRIIRPTCPDASFLIHCLDACLQTHGESFSHLVQKDNLRHFPLTVPGLLPTLMRVIDITEWRICPMSTSSTYTILSYVWGNSNFLRLTRGNLLNLMSEDGLRKLKVPKTISDALEVTRILGMRYLWVDSLCIVQDNEEDKKVQIQRMDKIYSEATLKIIAFD